jgi:hypothetical protein
MDDNARASRLWGLGAIWMSIRSPGVSVMRDTTLSDQGVIGIFGRKRNSVTVPSAATPAALHRHFAVSGSMGLAFLRGAAVEEFA